MTDSDATTWRETATTGLLLRGPLTVDAARAAVDEAVHAAELAGETPARAYGDPRDWAQTRIAELREEGADVFDDAPSYPSSVRGVLAAALGTAAAFTVGFTVHELVTKGLHTTTSAAMWVVPMLLSFSVVVLGAVFERLQRARGFRYAVLAAAALGAGTVAVTVAAAMILHEVPWSGATLWLASPAPPLALAAWLVGRSAHGDDPGPAFATPAGAAAGDVEMSGDPTRTTTATDTPDAIDDAAWADIFVRTLRGRGDHTDTQVAHALTEARTHAAETGVGLAAEFGPPRAYALALPRRVRPAVRRRLALQAFTGVCLAVILTAHTLEGGWGWDGRSLLYGAMTAVWLWVVAGYVRELRRAPLDG